MALVAGTLLSLGPAPANATTIERVVSPGGIKAWLVREPAVPLIVVKFAFVGGSSQDPEDKPGVATLAAGLWTEGAGDLKARKFQEGLENKAIELDFLAERDHVRGSLRTLKENRDAAFDYLRLALTKPRFDTEAVERARAQTMSQVQRQSTSPNSIAILRWWKTAFPGHPYGRSVVIFGGAGIARNDPDFMPALIVNHVLGNGSSSRLFRKVREKRGLAYGISESLLWLKHASVFLGDTAVSTEATGETIGIIKRE